MQRRRWLLAGVLAGFSTAVGPVALAVVPACAVAAVLKLRRLGWNDRRAWRSLLAPVLAPAGLACFGFYLWLHDGTPLASYQAQRYGWQEKSSPLALLHTAQRLIHEIDSAPSLAHMASTRDCIAGLIGAGILLVGLWLILRAPPVPVPSILWTLLGSWPDVHLPGVPAQRPRAAVRVSGDHRLRAAPARTLVHRLRDLPTGCCYWG